jgi:hypothetical protein
LLPSKQATLKNLENLILIVYNIGMKTITPDYIAGFIDGEGYIGIIKKKDYTRKGCSALGYYFTPSIKISQSLKNSKVLVDIADWFGFGNFYQCDRGSSKNQAVANSLEFRGEKRCKVVIDKITPYLRVKHEQAKLLQEYFNLPKPSNGRTDYHNESRVEINKQREDIHRKILKLNRRGLAETE